MCDFCEKRAKNNPDDIKATMEWFFMNTHLLATESMAGASPQRRAESTVEEMEISETILQQELTDLQIRAETEFDEPDEFVTTFNRKPGTDDLTDFDDPDFMYADDLFPMNFVLLWIWTVSMTSKGRIIARVPEKRATLGPRIPELALKICKMFEALKYCDESPPGSLRCASMNLHATNLFLTKEQKHIDWACRQNSILENDG